MKTLTETLIHIVNTLQANIAGCCPVSVGGSVRDALINTTGNIEADLALGSKDYDLEVFGATPSEIQKVLTAAGYTLEEVGRSFPVFKVQGWNIDISLPRTERCTGTAHTDYEVTVDPFMTFANAALRRDFTVNAIGYDWKTKSLLDPYNGMSSIRQGILTPVSVMYKDDALRVLRAFKFIARYGFTPSLATVNYSREMVTTLEGYARERIMKEWEDFVLKADSMYVQNALNFLDACGASRLFPEIFQLKTVPQQPEHHPEGDVYKHTIHCFEEFCHIRNALTDDREKLVVGFAVLCHDMGKASETHCSAEGKITAHGHENTGHARSFMERLYHPAEKIIVEITQLVQAHMRPVALYATNAGLSSIRRLNVAVDGRLDRLMHVVWCDQNGRPGKPPNVAALSWFAEQVKQLGVVNNEKIQPIVKGRHIIEHLKLEPGPRIGELVKQLFEAQLDGKFNDLASGIVYLKANIPG